MSLSVDQVLALAPDPSAASAARKLGVPKPWSGLGQSERAMWGECQGSALYQVRVDLTDMASKCSCPSRKFPCKHALGMLLLAASSPTSFPGTTPPEWVSDWLARRASTAERKEARAAEPAKAPDSEAQAKRAEQRSARVRKGVDALDLWMSDLIRNGLASVPSPPPWDAQAARLVDAQAPALASRVRRLGEIESVGAEGASRLLDELGKIALLSHAFRRIDALPPSLQSDVRQLLGWTLTHDEVTERGETVADEWLVVGQAVEDADRVRVQRSWLVGARTSRTALVLQFSAGGTPFGENVIPGTAFEADLVYWPSASPLRATIRTRGGPQRVWSERLPGFDRIDAFLTNVAEQVARLPWLERTAACLRGVTPIHLGPRGRIVRDADGRAIPLGSLDTWSLFALSGGAPIDLAGEWDGSVLVPLAAVVDGAFHVFANGAE